MQPNRIARRRSWLCGLATALALAAAPAAAESVLRVVPQADLKILDPIFTTANITSNHGYLVYDVLFALDAQLAPKPEMIESYTLSQDMLLWSFTLRDGLKFSDGSPVEAKDVVPSIKRWAARMPAGQTMMKYVDAIEAKGPLQFEIRMKKPFGAMLLAMASPENPLFVMREAEANVDPNQQVKDVVGSGPFTFVKEEWVPGNKVVYKKNPLYKPRAEPPSGFAGGKVAKVDRIEWVYLPEAATAVQALSNGEVDAIEIPAADLLPVLRKNPDIEVKVIDRIGTQAIMRPNQLNPPFDNPKARQALLYIVGNQRDYWQAMVGDEKLAVPCWSVFVCGTPLANDAGIGDWPKLEPKAGIAKAKALFQEAGYKGEKVVLMDPTDQALAHAQALVTAEKLKEAGVNVDLQAMDWGTMISRRPIKDGPDKNPGGWSIFFTWGGGLAMNSPLTNIGLATPCDRTGWFGWPCDDELEKLRVSFFDAPTPEAQKEVAQKIQKRFFEVVPYIPPAQFLAPIAYRKNLTGVLDTARLVLWNIEKK